jgi:hypothetical protein
MFSSRDDYERVIKLLLRDLAVASRVGGDPLDRDADDNPRISWTDDELAEADRYRLDVTQRPGGHHAPELELRLLVDDGWDPRYADDVEEDP